MKIIMINTGRVLSSLHMALFNFHNCYNPHLYMRELNRMEVKCIS